MGNKQTNNDFFIETLYITFKNRPYYIWPLLWIFNPKEREYSSAWRIIET